MTAPISCLDHLVLTVRDIEAAVAFYTQALGMEARKFGDGRTALQFGSVERTGATGLLQSIYIRDPDFNLIEIASVK